MKKELSITESQGSESRGEKRRKFFAALIFLGLILPLLVLATTTTTTIEIKNPLKAKTFEELIDNVATFLFHIALALFPLMIVIAGLYFVTAAGDPKKVETAKNIILYTCIGFIVILLAKGFIVFLKQYLGI